MEGRKSSLLPTCSAVFTLESFLGVSFPRRGTESETEKGEETDKQ